MSTLYDALKMTALTAVEATQPCDMVIGTVTSINPLEIKTSASSPPLRSQVLYLTSAVVEKTMTTLSHNHTVNGDTTSTELQNVVVTENGTALPNSGSITINRGLSVGDKVLMMKVQKGQKFIVLSRIF